MTHPNAEYWLERVKVSDEKNTEVKKAIHATIANTNDQKLFDLLRDAYVRLTATQSLADSLAARVKFYEEEIALLK